jgi:hypothetical protein
MTCSRCQEAYANGKPENFESEPECAFKTDQFDSSNWNCQTMNELRELAEEHAIYSNDQWAAIIPIPEPKNDEERGSRVADFIILGWYKHRGRTEAAYMLNESTLTPLTLEVAEKVLGGK